MLEEKDREIKGLKIDLDKKKMQIAVESDCSPVKSNAQEDEPKVTASLDSLKLSLEDGRPADYQ